MLVEIENNNAKRLQWLKELKENVNSDIKEIGEIDDSTDMTIDDFEKWIKEIDAEIATLSN